VSTEPPISAGLELVRSPNVNVLLLDDDPVNLHLRGAILRQHGYASVSAMTIEEANQLLDQIDIAVLDYHLGHGKFGTEVALKLRKRRPEDDIADVVVSVTPDMTGSAERNQAMEKVRGVLGSMSAEQRGALEMAYFEGLTHTEIAAKTGEPLGTVKTRIRSGLLALRKVFN